MILAMLRCHELLTKWHLQYRTSSSLLTIYDTKTNFSFVFIPFECCFTWGNRVKLMLKKTSWQNSPKRWGVTIIIFYFSKKCLCFLHHWSEWNNEIHCGVRLSLKQQKGSSQEIHWKAFDRAFFWHILINISNWCIFPLQIIFSFLFFLLDPCKHGSVMWQSHGGR